MVICYVFGQNFQRNINVEANWIVYFMVCRTITSSLTMKYLQINFICVNVIECPVDHIDDSLTDVKMT